METTNKSLTLCYVLIFLGIPGSGTSSESLLEGFVSRYFVVFQIFLFPQWFQFIACLVMLWLIFLKKYPSSALHLVYFCHLFGFTPEMWVTDSVCSAYLEDSSQAAVDEGLYFSDCRFGCCPKFLFHITGLTKHILFSCKWYFGGQYFFSCRCTALALSIHTDMHLYPNACQ